MVCVCVFMCLYTCVYAVSNCLNVMVIMMPCLKQWSCWCWWWWWLADGTTAWLRSGPDEATAASADRKKPQWPHRLGESNSALFICCALSLLHFDKHLSCLSPSLPIKMFTGKVNLPKLYGKSLLIHPFIHQSGSPWCMLMEYFMLGVKCGCICHWCSDVFCICAISFT